MVEWLIHGTDGVAIKGSLDQQHLVKLLPIDSLLSDFKDQLNIDLSGIVQVDSAGIAFILELKEIAAKTNLKVTFHGSTCSLDKLKSLYNLEQII